MRVTTPALRTPTLKPSGTVKATTTTTTTTAASAAGTLGDQFETSSGSGSAATSSPSPASPVAIIARPLKLGSAHEISPLTGPEAVNGAMRTLIQSARTELLIMVHAISDPVVVELIAERARAGVAVTVVRNDPQAQVGVRQSRKDTEQRLLDLLAAAGARVVIVPMEQLARSTSLSTPHDHRKLIVADRGRAYVGGANPRSHLDNFDTGLVISGPVVKQLLRSAAADIARYTLKTGGQVSPLPLPVENPDSAVLSVLSTNVPGCDAKSAILKAIAGAQKRITIANQEIDDDDVIRALVARKAQVPGLVVNVLIGPRQLKKTLAGFAMALPMNLLAIQELPKAGIKVFSATNRLERGGIMHAKLMVVDGSTTICGSSDLNQRSFGGNVELDLRVKSAAVGAAFERGILDEIAQSTPVTSTTRQERLVSRAVGAVRSAAVSFGHSRRLLARMSFGFSPSGRRILRRQKLGHAGPPVRPAPKSVAEARAQLLAALATTSLTPPAPKTLHSSLQPGERLLYVGVTPHQADLLEGGVFSPAVNTNFGAGMYFASDCHTAIDYSLVRSKSELGTGAVFVVAAKLDRVLEFPAGQAAFDAWVKLQPVVPDKPLALLPHYCREHGYDATVIKDAEGPGRDYVVVYDEHRLRPMLRQDLGGPLLPP
ncbi:MAG: phospholipase D-like domain-containing protein [Deltaproteobacteria bacterium]|nr:phospholipase D-like domain-containing protein [Deltaproteobacteria bacterium]